MPWLVIYLIVVVLSSFLLVPVTHRVRKRSSNMHFFTALAGGALLSTAVLASPTARYEVHEKRHQRNTGWSKVTKVHYERVLPVRVALAQSNMHMAHDWLMEVSDPTSEKYAQHWDAVKVVEMFKPRCVSRFVF